MNVKCFRAQYIKSLAAVLFSGVFLCGCFSHTAPEPQKPAFTPVMRVSDRMVARRKAAFKNIVKNIGVRGIAVYPGSWKHVPAQEVISKISAYGFNRIYFVITSECEIDGKLYELFAQAEKAKIGAHILLRQRDYFSPWQGNAFVRMFKTSYPQLVEVSKEIADLNEELVDDQKFLLIALKYFPSCLSPTGSPQSLTEEEALTDASSGAKRPLEQVSTTIC